MKIREQVRLHAVAIISLITALSGFTYNVVLTRWIEENATRRDATFQTLMALGELQEVVHFAHFQNDTSRGDPIHGWSKVLMVDDLIILVEPQEEDNIKKLKAVWQENWSTLEAPVSETKISEAIRQAREETLKVLASL